MIRTQISLPAQVYAAAKREAKSMGISLAAYLRRALGGVLPTSSREPWMRYSGIIASGDLHSSEKIDELVYGQKN